MPECKFYTVLQLHMFILNRLLLITILISQVLANIHIVYIKHASMFDTFTSCIS